MTYEREHDRDPARAADAVIADHAPPGRASSSAGLQRPGAPIPSGIVMRKGAGTASAGAEDAVSTAASSSSGSALPGELRSRFEGSLGVDLSGVRVHTGAESAAAARSVSARAYAVGQDIHFGAGQYAPGTSHGDHLIAHEVAHTVQQRGGVARQHKLEVSHAGDAHEVEADRAADAMVRGAAARVSAIGGGVIQRDPDRNPLTGEPTLPRPLYWSGHTVDDDPTGAWTGAPTFSKVAVGDMSEAGVAWVNKVGAMKDAFTAVWGQAQGTWAGAVGVFADYKAAAQDAENKNLADFGGKGSDIDLDAEAEDFGGKSSVSDANLQDSNKLEAGKKTFDRDKVDETLKRTIIAQKAAIRDSKRGFDTAERGIDTAKTNLDTAGRNLSSAVGNLKVKEGSKKVTEMNRVIDDHKKNCERINKAIGIMTKVAKKEYADAAGEALQMINTEIWQAKIDEIESAIHKLEDASADAEIEGAQNARAVAQNEVRIAKNAVQDAIDAYKTECGKVKKAYADLAESLKAAALKSSGGNSKVAERVRAAVEAIPLMELTLGKCTQLKNATVAPAENMPACQGGGLSDNGGEFLQHVGILNSWNQQMVDAVAKWTKRLDLAKKLVNQAQ